MTTAITSAILSQALVANMNAWVGELYTQMLACGLSQTNDSGQLVVSGGNANIVSLPSGTGVANAVGYFCFTFNDALALGSLSTTALSAGGSGGTTGTYTSLVITGAISGANSARGSVTVSGGAAGNITVTTAGSGYIVGEKLTIASGITGLTGGAWTASALVAGAAPVIFRLDFGGGGATTDPQMWITLGQGTNGAGVIAGTAGTTKMTQVACFSGGAPLSPSTPYTSYYCYNATYGCLNVIFKVGAGLATIGALGSVILYRSNNTGGAATGTSISLLTNNTTTTGASSGGVQQTLNYANSLVYPTLSSGNSQLWTTIPGSSQPPYGLTGTLENSTVFIFPTMIYNQAFGYSAFVGVAFAADIAIGTTVSSAIIGATPITFLSCGPCFGGGTGIGVSTASGMSLMAVFQ